MKALVVGLGSIGSRHVRILRELGCEVAILSRHAPDPGCGFHSLREALDTWKPGYVVIANETSAHYDTLTELGEAGFAGIVLIEKPLFESVHDVPANQFRTAYLAYNLRFHPVLQELSRILAEEQQIISAHVYAGQHLPLWRPDVDYRSSYSASSTAGGGALRDLSHELDYSLWLCGRWLSVTAAGGHYSHLEISSDDIYSITIKTQKCLILNIQVNYLDRIGCREIRINTDRRTIAADLISGSLQINDALTDLKCDYDHSYRRQHQAVMEGDRKYLCTLDEGIEVLHLIEAVETAAVRQEWVNR